MEEWACRLNDSQMKANVGVYSLSAPAANGVPTYGLIGSGTGFDLRPLGDDGKPAPEVLVRVNPGWKHASKIENVATPEGIFVPGSAVTKQQGAATRSIGIVGFGKTVGMVKAADKDDPNKPGINLQGISFKQGSGPESGKPTMSFETDGCDWLASAPQKGCVVAEIVMGIPPWGDGPPPGPDEEITMNPQQYMDWVSAAVGVRLLSALTAEEKQLLLAVCAASCPFMLRGCELTLDSHTKKRDIG
jgi:hypothetical protein